MIFGVETALNLLSDVLMLISLQSWKSRGTKLKLLVFLAWNSLSTVLCYVTTLVYIHAMFTEAHKVDLYGTAPTHRITNITWFTSVFIIKVQILYYIGKFYQLWEQRVQEADELPPLPPGSAPFPGPTAPMYGYSGATQPGMSEGGMYGVPYQAAGGGFARPGMVQPGMYGMPYQHGGDAPLPAARFQQQPPSTTD
ncbi:uncharacterized protein LOC144153615 [Haemaphysalis longicornis]